ncbi:MAG TPA: flavin reductase [Candidatus Fimivicinus intestinavium]|nr:flavin reductase [Candidatus Fimivicinus intestinavium]
MPFQEINIRDLKESAVKLISEDWALVTAGNKDKWNTMTVSWGGLGELWGKDVAFIFIRPQRYTYAFLEREAYFTMSFFGGAYKKELSFCGAKSGRDVDKAKETGLTPLFTGQAVAIEQAKLVLVCRKLAYQDLNPAGFIDSSIDAACYPSRDYHRMYVGAIESVLLQQESD